MSKRNGKAPVYTAGDGHERGLLAALLKDPVRIRDVLRTVRPDHFRVAAHQDIYRAMGGQYRDSGMVTLRGIGERLQRADRWHEQTGAFLSELWQESAAGGELEYHRQEMLKAARVRGLRMACLQTLADIDGRAGSPEQLVEAARGRLVDSVDSGDASDWQPPIPLADRPEAPDFPAGVLPRRLAGFVADGAAALSCPADYLGVPMLALAGAAAGASRALEIKPGWRERPALYCAIVGPPGSAKTPALKAVAAPFYEEQARLYQHYRREMVRHEEEEGPRPTERAVFVSDVTVEKLADVLQDNPRGVAIIRDELTAWVSAMNQYKSRGGADRQFYLSAWAGEPVSVHRKNQQAGPVFVPHPFLAVAGGIPPDLLNHMRGGREVADGFLDRILFAFPEPHPAVGEDWACIDPEGSEAWRAALRSLWDLGQEEDRDGGKAPMLVRLTGCGRKAWQEFTRGLAEQVNAEDFPDCLRGPWSKLKGYGARLALIVHLLWAAAGEAEWGDVDGEAMRRAALLVGYFQGHARKAYAQVDADPRVAGARKVLRWILRKGEDVFTKRDAHQDLRRSLGAEDLDGPLGLLARHGYIRAVGEPRKGPGRAPSPAYEVNPHARTQNPQNPQN